MKTEELGWIIALFDNGRGKPPLSQQSGDGTVAAAGQKLPLDEQAATSICRAAREPPSEKPPSVRIWANGGSHPDEAATDAFAAPGGKW